MGCGYDIRVKYLEQRLSLALYEFGCVRRLLLGNVLYFTRRPDS